MRHLLKTLSVRASIVSQGAQRGFRIARALGSQNGCLNRQHRLDTESRRCMSGHGSLIGADGIVRSPIPDEVFPDLSLSDYIFSRLKLFGDKTALIDGVTGKSYTYSQIEELSRKVGSFLTRQGFRKGDVVCYFGTNNPDFPLLLLGCASVGVILTTANPAYTAGELKRQLGSSGAKAVFTVPAVVDKVKAAGVQDITVIGEAEGCRPFSKVLEDDGKAFPNDVTTDNNNDVIILPFSSGTTGLPKGVMLTHKNIVVNLIQYGKSLKTTPDDMNVVVLPFFHIYAMVPVLFGTLQDGGTLVTLPAFEPQGYVSTLVNHKATQIHVVPPILLFLTKHPMVDGFDLSSIRDVMCAAAPLGESMSHEFIEKRKLRLRQGFGMTETSPVTHIDQEPLKVGSIGPLICNTEAKVVDLETGKVLGPNTLGELAIRGPQNMKGYFNNEKATRDMITEDGWLHTGDVGFFMEDGRFVIEDRVKDLIKFKGLQIAPAEIEDLIQQHSEVLDVAVIGVPDERAGEVPRAFVVCKPGTKLTETDIVQFVQEHVSDHKKLRGGVKFLSEIPKSPSGKILRRALREESSK